MTTLSLPLSVIRSVASFSKVISSGLSKTDREFSPVLDYTKFTAGEAGAVSTFITNRYCIGSLNWTPKERPNITGVSGESLFVDSKTLANIVAMTKTVHGSEIVTLSDFHGVHGDEGVSVSISNVNLISPAMTWNFPPIERLLTDYVDGQAINAGVRLKPKWLAGLASIMSPGQTVAQAKDSPWEIYSQESSSTRSVSGPVTFRRMDNNTVESWQLRFMVQPEINPR